MVHIYLVHVCNGAEKRNVKYKIKYLKAKLIFSFLHELIYSTDDEIIRVIHDLSAGTDEKIVNYSALLLRRCCMKRTRLSIIFSLYFAFFFYFLITLFRRRDLLYLSCNILILLF